MVLGQIEGVRPAGDRRIRHGETLGSEFMAVMGVIHHRYDRRLRTI